MGNDTPHLVHIPIEHVKTFIREKFPKTSLTNLLEEGINLRENIGIDNNIPAKYCKPISRRILDKIEFKELEPRFPFPEERRIQIDAYSAWIENGKKVYLLWQPVLVKPLQLLIAYESSIRRMDTIKLLLWYLHKL